MIGWNVLIGPQRPSGAVGEPEMTYYRVGDGTPSGGQLGYDVTWRDAGGAVVMRQLAGLAGAVVIDELEYDALVETWSI